MLGWLSACVASGWRPGRRGRRGARGVAVAYGAHLTRREQCGAGATPAVCEGLVAFSAWREIQGRGPGSWLTGFFSSSSLPGGVPVSCSTSLFGVRAGGAAVSSWARESSRGGRGRQWFWMPWRKARAVGPGRIQFNGPPGWIQGSHDGDPGSMEAAAPSVLPAEWSCLQLQAGFGGRRCLSKGMRAGDGQGMAGGVNKGNSSRKGKESGDGVS